MNFPFDSLFNLGGSARRGQFAGENFHFDSDLASFRILLSRAFDGGGRSSRSFETIEETSGSSFDHHLSDVYGVCLGVILQRLRCRASFSRCLRSPRNDSYPRRSERKALVRPTLPPSADEPRRDVLSPPLLRFVTGASLSSVSF